MIHCDPVVERWTSSWIVGSEIATIVWSMKVIETAKIIAARISLRVLAAARHGRSCAVESFRTGR